MNDYYWPWLRSQNAANVTVKNLNYRDSANNGNVFNKNDQLEISLIKYKMYMLSKQFIPGT